MAISDKIAAVDSLHDEAQLGYSADIVLKAMDPILERRLALLLDQFQTCQPELSYLLDLRAKISEIWRIRKELLKAKSDGSRAVEVLKTIIEAEKRTPNGKGAS